MDNQLERIAVALEALVKNGGAIVTAPLAERVAKPAPVVGKTAKPAAVAAVAPKSDDLVEALRVAVTAKKSEGAREILTKYGAKKISEVKPADFAAVVSELTALVKADDDSSMLD